MEPSKVVYVKKHSLIVVVLHKRGTKTADIVGMTGLQQITVYKAAKRFSNSTIQNIMKEMKRVEDGEQEAFKFHTRRERRLLQKLIWIKKIPT